MDEQTRVQPLEGQVVVRAAPPSVPVTEVRDAGPVTALGGPPPVAAPLRTPVRGRGVLAAAAVGLALVGGVGGFAVGQATSGSSSTGTGTAGTGTVQGPGGAGRFGGSLPGGTGRSGGTPPDGALPGDGTNGVPGGATGTGSGTGGSTI